MDTNPEEKKSPVQGEGKMKDTEVKELAPEPAIPQRTAPPEPEPEPISKESPTVLAAAEDVPDPDEDDLDDLDGLSILIPLFV